MNNEVLSITFRTEHYVITDAKNNDGSKTIRIAIPVTEGMMPEVIRWVLKRAGYDAISQEGPMIYATKIKWKYIHPAKLELDTFLGDYLFGKYVYEDTQDTKDALSNISPIVLKKVTTKNTVDTVKEYLISRLQEAAIDSHPLKYMTDAIVGMGVPEYDSSYFAKYLMIPGVGEPDKSAHERVDDFTPLDDHVAGMRIPPIEYK